MPETHWTEKRKWIAEAVAAGGRGQIYCTGETTGDSISECDAYERCGFGGAECRGCREAERVWSNGTVEFWRTEEDT